MSRVAAFVYYYDHRLARVISIYLDGRTKEIVTIMVLEKPS